MADLKQASLYFDRVIPINPLELIRYQDKPLSESYSIIEWKKDRFSLLRDSLEEHQDLVISLAFSEKPNKVDKKIFLDSLDELTKVLQFQGMESHPSAFFNADYVMNQYHHIQQHLAAESLLKNDRIKLFDDRPIQSIVNSFYKKFNFEHVSPFLPASHESVPSDDIMVTLAEMKLVDVEKTSLEEIISFREDIESRKRFQRLRRFATLNLNGKPKNHIEDELAKCIDDYEAACKEHGFQTSHSVLTTLIKSKTLLATAGTGIAGVLATLAGSSVEDVLGIFTSQVIGAGFVVDVADILLQARKSSHGYERLIDTNSCGYIISAEKAFNPL